MKFSSTALATALAVAPSLTEGYGLGFYSPRVVRPMVITQGGAAAARRRSMTDGSSVPRYEITDNDEKFQVAVDVPGVKAEDISVSLEDGMLSLSGQRQSSNEQYQFSSKFSQNFSFDPAVDSEKFTANLENGVLVVSAPKDMRRLEANIKSIPIVDGAAQGETKTAALEPSVEDETPSGDGEEIVDLDSSTNIDSKDPKEA